MRTIAAVGAYGFRNFGDDALMRAVAQATATASRSDRLVFRCPHDAYLDTIAPGASVEPPEGGDVPDIVVYGGGTQFYSFPRTSPSLLQRAVRRCGRGIRVTQWFPRAASAARRSSPRPRMAAIGIGLGPFVRYGPEIRRTKLLLRRMEYVAVRDMGSYELCRRWGLGHAVLRADLCYLPGLWTPSARAARQDASRAAGRRIGVIVRDWPHTREGDAYARPLFAVVDRLRALGSEVEFVSFAEPYDRTWLASLAARGERPRTWCPDVDDIPSFLGMLAGFDALLTARYHGAVFASILGRPVVCIEVEPKLRLVSEMLGDGARLWRHPFDVEQCLRHVADLDGDHARAVQTLRRVADAQEALAAQMVEEYRQMLSR